MSPTNVLPLFDRDRQMCGCGHIGGQYEHEVDGQFAGIGLGGCQHQPDADDEFHGLDRPCECTKFDPR